MSTAVPEALNAAMRSYVDGYARHSRPMEISDDFLAEVRRLRAEIRAEEGGGGMCHVVTEVLQARHGLERLLVTYLAPGGEVIMCGHRVSVLSDGTLLDPTADQIGEGHDIRILRPDDPEYGRYRPEFDCDYHPGHPGHPDVDDDRLDGWGPYWNGLEDRESQDRLTVERGKGWWVDDKTALIAYYEEQVRLADDVDDHYQGVMRYWLDDDHYQGVMRYWLDDIRSRESLSQRDGQARIPKGCAPSE